MNATSWVVDGLYFSTEERTRIWRWLTRFLGWRLAARTAMWLPTKVSPCTGSHYARCSARINGGPWQTHEAVIVPGTPGTPGTERFWIDGQPVPRAESALHRFVHFA